MGPGGNLFAITMIVGLLALSYPYAIRFFDWWHEPTTREFRNGKSNDWVLGPIEFPVSGITGRKYFVDGKHPVPLLQKKNEKETKRVMDHIERNREFWAAKEVEYEALRAAKKERIKLL
jgi:hypothetical protein